MGINFMRINSAFKKIAIAATIALTFASIASATDYTLTGASFNDGSSFSGSWSVDWTTNEVTALNLNHGNGTSITSTSTSPSAASTFNLSSGPRIWNTAPNGPAGVWEMNVNSSNDSQYLNLDFNKNTGAIYVGNASLGSNLDLPADDGYVTFNGGSASVGVSVSAVPEPESYAMLLAGLGLMGFMVRRRKTS